MNRRGAFSPGVIVQVCPLVERDDRTDTVPDTAPALLNTREASPVARHQARHEHHHEARHYQHALRQWWGGYRWNLYLRVSLDSGSKRTLQRLVRRLLHEIGRGECYAVVVYERRPHLHAHLLVGHRRWRTHAHYPVFVHHRCRPLWEGLCVRAGFKGTLWGERYRRLCTADGQYQRGVAYASKTLRDGEAEWEVVGRLQRDRRASRPTRKDPNDDA